jgi:hypothetical protein
MSQENVEAVRRQHEHFSRTGQVLSEIYDSDAEWEAAREDPDAATHRGWRRYAATSPSGRECSRASIFARRS